jgi:hypothetical protein
MHTDEYDLATRLTDEQHQQRLRRMYMLGSRRRPSRLMMLRLCPGQQTGSRGPVWQARSPTGLMPHEVMFLSAAINKKPCAAIMVLMPGLCGHTRQSFHRPSKPGPQFGPNPSASTSRQSGPAFGLWSVGVCSKSREQSGGEKPRATTVLKMTHDEIRAARRVCCDEPAV